MSNAIVYYDELRGIPVDSTGGITRVSKPILGFGAVTSIEYRFVSTDTTLGTTSPVDVSDAIAWAAAVDKDWDSATEPMSRILDADIDDSEAAAGIIRVTIDCRGATFMDALGTSAKIDAYFDLYGYDAEAVEIHTMRALPLTAVNAIDPAGGDPPDPVGNFYTKTEADIKFVDNPMTAANDLIVGGVDGAMGRLPVGTAGQALTIDSLGDIEWGEAGVAAFSTLTDVSLASVAHGDLLVVGSDLKIKNLGHGTANQLLSTMGAAMDPEWVDAPTSGGGMSANKLTAKLLYGGI